MSGVTGEDIERLASRVAMLVSDDGEADNAGRAVGQLARRLGLSGGDLKQLFLDGAAERAGAPGEVARLEQELAVLRQKLVQLEEAARAARNDRDVLIVENGAMRVTIYRHGVASRMRRLLVGLVVLGVTLVGLAVAWMGPDVPVPPRRDDVPSDLARPASNAPPGTSAQVRSSRATLYREPNRTSEVLAHLPVGTRLVVNRKVWNMMMQWAEVELGRGPGYVALTDVDLF